MSDKLTLNYASKNKSFFFIWPIFAKKVTDEETLTNLSLSAVNSYILSTSGGNQFRVSFDAGKLTGKDLRLLEKHPNFASIDITDLQTVVSFNILEEEKESYEMFCKSKYSHMSKHHKDQIVSYLYYLSSKLKVIDNDVYVIAGQILWKDKELKKRLLEFFGIDKLDDDIELSNSIDLTKEVYYDY